MPGRLLKKKTERRAANSRSKQIGDPEDTSRVQRRRARLKNDILDSARNLFARFGIERVRFEDVAEAADIARGTLYSFFKNKEALAEETLKSVYQKLEEGIDKIKFPDPRRSVEELLELYCDLWEKDRAGLVLALEMPQAGGVAIDLQARLQKKIERIFRKAEAQLRSNNARTTARLFTRASVPSLEALAESGADVRRQFVDHFKNLLLR